MIGHTLHALWGVISGARARVDSGTHASRRPLARVRLWQLAAALLLQAAIVMPAFAQTMTYTGASPTTFTGPGQVITFTLKFATANDAVSQVTAFIGPSRSLTCVGLPLAANSSTTCSYTYTTTASDTADLNESGVFQAVINPAFPPYSGVFKNPPVITYLAPATVPGAPTIGTATAGNASAKVTFSVPASNGGSAITGYTATSSPGGITASGFSSPLTVMGLANGTPYSFKVTATNAIGTGAASAASNSVTPLGVQTITFANPGARNFGTTPTLSATASSGLTPTFSSTTSGVCTITSGGALTFGSAGTCSIDADQAGNGTYLAAPTVSRSFSVNAVGPAKPGIGTATAGNALATVSFTPPASNGGAAITGYTVTSSPGGFTATGSSGPLTVTGLTNGTPYTFTVTAINSAGTGLPSPASNSVTPLAPVFITVSPATLPAATVSTAYSQTIAANGGTGPYTYALTVGSLPPGVSLSSSGQLSGAPTAGGSFNFTVVATDTNAVTGARALTLTVNAPTIAVAPTTLSSPTVGSTYSASISASGGTAPYTYAVTAGALPAGITLAGNGTVSGIPTATGAFNVTITATDSSTGSGPYTGSRAYSFTVAAPAAPTVANKSVTTAYNTPASIDLASSITGAGITAVTIGTAPTHGTASVSGTTVTYTPSSTFYGGSDSFTYTATNAGGTSAPATVSLTVNAPPPAIASPSAASTSYNTPVTIDLSTLINGAGIDAVFITHSPAHGNLTLAGQVVTYTPSSSFYGGTDSFEYLVGNPGGLSNPATVTITVGGPAAPTAAPKSVLTAFNTPAAIDLSASVSGVNITTVDIGNGPAHGVVSVAGKVVTYTPSPSYYGGPDSFTYSVTDVGGTSPPATVSITVGLPAAPIAAAASVTTAYNTPASIDLASSITGAGITAVTIGTAPTHGTASVSGTTVTYTPSSTYYGGNDSFTYTATNPGGTSAPATVTITVGLPAAPTAAAKAVSTPYNTAASIDMSSSITGVGITTVTIGFASTHGTVSVVGATVTYTPSSTYYGGSDSFTYTATNAGGTSAPATVSITVGLPAAPTTATKAVSTPYNTAASIDLSGSITGVGITAVAIGTAPTHGTVSVSGTTVTYTPSSTYYGGSDSFTYTATNAGGTSAPATVTIAVGTPAAPTAAAKSVSTAYNTDASIDLASSITGVNVTAVTIITTPAHGTVSVAGTTVTYTPSSTYYGGSDSFTYTATNPGGTSAPATVSITVGLPAAPTVANKSVTTAYNTVASIDLSGSITGVGITAVAIGTVPMHGTVSVSGTTVTYTPSSTYYGGSDSFTYTATNPGGTSSPATVTISVGLPAAPVVFATSISTVYNTAASIDLSGLITGVAISGITIITAPSHGTASVNGQAVTYTPSSTYYGGSDSFTYTASNPGGTSATAVVSITVTPLATPTATALSVATMIGVPVLIHATNGVTGPMPLVGVSVATAPVHGSASVSGEQITYTPNAGFTGTDTFTYQVANNFGKSSPATITISITAEGQSGDADANKTVVTAPGMPVTLNLADLLAGTYVSSAVVGFSPANAGTVVLSQPSTFTFTSTDTFRGLAQVSLVLTDSSGRKVSVNLLLLVSSQPDPSRNPDVLGLINAQTTAAQRFATSQLDNIQRRMEGRRDGAGAGMFSNTLSINRDGRPTRASGDGRVSAENPFRLYGQSNEDPSGQTRSGIGAMEVPSNVPVATEEPVTDARAGSQAGGPPGFGVWIGGIASFGRYDAYQQAAGFDSVNVGINIGIDQQLGEKGLVGFSLGYNHDDSSIGDVGTRSIATGYSGALYGSYKPMPQFYFDAVLGGGKLKFDSRRHDRDTDTFLRGYRNGDQWFASLTVGYEYRNAHGTLVSPYLRLQQSLSHLDGFAETGAATAALMYGRQTVRSSLAVLGLRTSWQIKLSNGVLVPNARLEVGHDFQGVDDTTIDYVFIPSAGLWNVFANPYSANGTSVQAGVGFDLQLERRLTWSAEFGYQHQSNARSQMIRLGVKKEF